MREFATVVTSQINVHAKPGGKEVGWLGKGARMEVIRREGPPAHKLVWYQLDVPGIEGDAWVCERTASGELCITIEAEQLIPDVHPPRDDYPPLKPPFCARIPAWVYAGGGVLIAGLLLYWLGAR
jgi:hypothetical protein